MLTFNWIVIPDQPPKPIYRKPTITALTGVKIAAKNVIYVGITNKKCCLFSYSNKSFQSYVPMPIWRREQESQMVAQNKRKGLNATDKNLFRERPFAVHS